jgi:hypothetical protein
LVELVEVLLPCRTGRSLSPDVNGTVGDPRRLGSSDVRSLVRLLRHTETGEGRPYAASPEVRADHRNPARGWKSGRLCLGRGWTGLVAEPRREGVAAGLRCANGERRRAIPVSTEEANLSSCPADTDENQWSAIRPRLEGERPLTSARLTYSTTSEMATVTDVGPRLGIAPICGVLGLPRATYYR